MSKLLIWLTLFIAVVLEGAVTTLPLVVLTLLVFSVVTKKQELLVVAFFSGLLLDIVRLSSLGQTSLFLLIFIFVVLLYDRKFEIQTLPFVAASSFLGSLAYLMIFVHNQIFMQALTSSIIALLLFKLLSKPKISLV